MKNNEEKTFPKTESAEDSQKRLQRILDALPSLSHAELIRLRNFVVELNSKDKQKND